MNLRSQWLKLGFGVGCGTIGFACLVVSMGYLYVGGRHHTSDREIENKLKKHEPAYFNLIENAMGDDLQYIMVRPHHPLLIGEGEIAYKTRKGGDSARNKARIVAQKERWYLEEMNRLKVELISAENDGTYILIMSSIGWAGGATRKGIAFSLTERKPLRMALDGSVPTYDVERCQYVYKKLWDYWYVCYTYC